MSDLVERLREKAENPFLYADGVPDDEYTAILMEAVEEIRRLRNNLHILEDIRRLRSDLQTLEDLLGL